MSEKIYLDDMSVGGIRISPTYTVPVDESVEFAKKWDPQPFHIDQEAGDAIYGGVTACSAYIFSVFCKVCKCTRNYLKTSK